MIYTLTKDNQCSSSEIVISSFSKLNKCWKKACYYVWVSKSMLGVAKMCINSKLIWTNVEVIEISNIDPERISKSRSWLARVLCVLSCLACLRTHVRACYACSQALMLGVLAWLSARALDMLTCTFACRACRAGMFTCSPTLVLTFLSNHFFYLYFAYRKVVAWQVKSSCSCIKMCGN